MNKILYKAKRLNGDNKWIFGLPHYDKDCNVKYLSTNTAKVYPNTFEIDTKTLCKYICSDTKGCDVFEYDIVYIPIDEGARVESLIPYVVYYSALNTGYMVISLEDAISQKRIPTTEYLCEFVDCLQYSESLFDLCIDMFNMDNTLSYINSH